MKSVLQSLFRIGFNIKCETKTLSEHALFTQGRVAEIIVGKNTVGYIGELDSKVLENFRIRTKAVAFEIKLNGLIFDQSVYYCPRAYAQTDYDDDDRYDPDDLIVHPGA